MKLGREHKRILVTGSSRGIGKASVRLLAELAGPFVFLLSDGASATTGEILNVNGGTVLCG